MMEIPYPLKRSFIDYFKLNQIDNTITARKLNDYLETVIRNSSNPQEKALELWDKFVMTNDNFFDITYCDMGTRVNQLRKDIVANNNIDYTLCVFRMIGVGAFCYPWTTKDLGSV